MIGVITYSVWNPATRAYDYYQAHGPAATHAPNPPAVAGSSELGATPDEAAWRLPPGARKVGTGELPRGRIATLGGADDVRPVPPYLLWAALGLVAWRVLR
jgi:hypothetical protein